VYRGTAAGQESPTPIAVGITKATYTNSALTNGEKFFYKVTAMDADGESARSNEASATPNK
jgi:hypothetical protein